MLHRSETESGALLATTGPPRPQRGHNSKQRTLTAAKRGRGNSCNNAIVHKGLCKALQGDPHPPLHYPLAP